MNVKCFIMCTLIFNVRNSSPWSHIVYRPTDWQANHEMEAEASYSLLRGELQIFGRNKMILRMVKKKEGH